ncbi:uncharacterized protein LOC109424595 [Aedes albopictus]|uniref:NACHT domain-containing protein n=1 Tax=Aedes albopictus TaxID=7160 RepID=A0ABM1ZRK2_AEDAL|nr:uncharacterized protein LOC109424595 [Aedes albopictus]XP_029710960.1 uncharacterized protein LOC109424595 [Aedes albopictus]
MIQQDIIDPETTRLVTYESSIKSGTHGEVYQKQLAQILLLRLTREAKDFHLAYELTSAHKFDDVVLYDKTAKQWIFMQLKHADSKESKIDLNGLLPQTHQEKGDFSLYKYFYSYMLIRKRFKGNASFLIFTNKRLDAKLQTANDCISIKDREVDEYLRFTTVGANHIELTPTESTIQSIMEYANKDLYSLKDAIKQLFTDGIITEVIQNNKAFLNDILEQSSKFLIGFKDTFNDSLISIAKIYKVLQQELHNFKPVYKPKELVIEEAENESPRCLTVEDQDFDHLVDAIRGLFRTGIASDYLKKYENFLALILTTTTKGQLAIKDTFNKDIVCKAELYRMLKAEMSDLNKEVSTKQMLFDRSGSRRKTHSVFYAEPSDVRQFFVQLTLSAHQPDKLEPFIVEELHSWMKMWLRPDVLGKINENDDKCVVKRLDDHFESKLKQEHSHFKPYLDQHFVTQFCNELQSSIVKQYPELSDTNQLYINRMLIFEKNDIDTSEYLNDSKFNGSKTSEQDPNSGSLVSLDYDSSETLDTVDNISLPDRTHEEMTDIQFAENLKLRFAHYQCIVLTADPGIGKTELLQYVALEHQKLKSGAVFLFYLNRIQDSKDILGSESSLDVLKSSISEENVKLIQSVLKNESNDHITVLFDGYDEVHEKNRNRINNLFVLLLKVKHVQLVVSVRNHEKQTLQSFFKKNKYNVGYFSLEPFNSENIIEYLAQSWKASVKSDPHTKFNSYSEFLVEKFYSLCRVPLMVKMMAEIYKQRFEQFKGTAIIDKESEISYLEREFLEVEHIYEIFIEKCLLVKIEDACNGIGKVDTNKQIFDGFYLDHQLLAIEFLDVGELKFIFNNPKYMKKRDCIQKYHLNQFEKSILVKFVGDHVFFSHHSYAEYFVANLLWDDFVYLKSIIKKVLSFFAGIRRFFIKIIEKNIKLFESRIAQETSFVSKNVVFWACESNAVELLKFALSKTFLFRPKEAKMLHIAIKNGCDKTCSYLIQDCGVHPDVKYHGGLAPLHSAIIYGHRNLMLLLLEKGADINIRNTEGWSALHYAVHHKRIAIAKFLIDEGIDVNSINKNKWNALHISCNNGDADMTKVLIQRGAQLDIQTNEGRSPLHLAAAGGHTEVVIILIGSLIKKFPLSSIIDNAFQTAVRYGHNSVKEMLIRKYPMLVDGAKAADEPLIHIAAQEGVIKKVKKLIQDGANVNAFNKTKLTALHLSAAAGHRPVVELLIDKGANVNAVEINEWTPLHLACKNGHKEVVQVLIKRGANIEALNNDNWTALHLSAFKGHCAVVDLLLKKGANVDAAGEHDMTPLYSACGNGHKDVVQALIKKGANVHALNRKKLTALHRSASEGYYDIVDLLLENGANVNAAQIDKWTPLHWACQNGHIEVVEALLRKGANINLLTYNKSTALHKSAARGHSGIVDLLLDNGANVNAVDMDNWTSLHLACQNGHKEVVATLIKKNANIHELNNNKWTALHLSASRGCCDVVDLLLENGADVNAVEMDNWTPLHCACQNGYKNIVMTLIRNGANIDAMNYNKMTALHNSASKGYSEIVNLLLDEKAIVNAVDVDQWTALHWACQNGHKEVVETLLSRGANIHAMTRKK